MPRRRKFPPYPGPPSFVLNKIVSPEKVEEAEKLSKEKLVMIIKRINEKNRRIMKHE